MKIIVAAIPSIALLLWAEANAQQASRWIDPSRAWSIDLAGSGWGAGQGLPGGGPILIAAPAEAPPDSEIRLCIVEQQVQQPAAAGESEIRGRAAAMDERA